MADLAERFESKVDRSGEHHVWTGTRHPDGSGQMRVNGKLTTSRRVAWELTNGPLPEGARVVGCADEPACVRVEHLSVVESVGGQGRRSRGSRGAGSRTKVRDGVYKLTVTVGHYKDGSRRRVHQTVHVDNEDQAADEQIRFAAEVRGEPLPDTKIDYDIKVDPAVELYLAHLADEKGRESRTITDYRTVHNKWGSPVMGNRRVRDINEATMDRIFGKMRAAGLSASRMNHARSLYAPFFRWAKRRRIIRRSPMVEFELPTSTQVAQERMAPEVEQLVRYLHAAVEVVPDVAPVLTLDAVTGMRRSELVTVQRRGLKPGKGVIKVATAADNEGKVKTTKTRKERDVAVDDETMAMLLRHCKLMDERAAVGGVTLGPDAFVFSLEPDGSKPMRADYLTKQVAKLKEHLGIGVKRPETIALEDEALRMFRQKPKKRPAGKTGPAPKGGMSFEEIGRRLNRTGRWAQLAVRAAQRREEAGPALDEDDFFDGSIPALRKFTSSELLDAGFNISMVARRQGHGPQVLIKHYAKGRRSADRKAAAHLGKVVHGI